jgi:hypothetical protein
MMTRLRFSRRGMGGCDFDGFYTVWGCWERLGFQGVVFGIRAASCKVFHGGGWDGEMGFFFFPLSFALFAWLRLDWAGLDWSFYAWGGAVSFYIPS